MIIECFALREREREREIGRQIFDNNARKGNIVVVVVIAELASATFAYVRYIPAESREEGERTGERAA